MSIGAIAARLYTIQSKKNIPLISAVSQVVRENLAVRFSVYSLVKSITKSETLATIAQAKYGKRTPEEREAEKEKQTARQQEVKFRRSVASSLVALNRKIDAVSAVVQKNSQLIEAMYNEVGSYKRQRRFNVRGASQVSARVPLQAKTLKGKIDQINADLEKIKKMDIAAKKKKVAAPSSKTKKETKEETGGLISSILGALMKNPTLMLALASGRPAIALARYGIPALALANLPGNLGRISGRLQGKQAYQDPGAERLSQSITPMMAGLGTYAGGMLLTSAYEKLKGPGPSKADRVYGGRAEQLMAERDAKKSSLLSKYDQKYKNNVGMTSGMNRDSMMVNDSKLRKYYDAKLKRTKTIGGFERVKKEYIVAMEKNKARYEARLNSKFDSKLNQSDKMRDRIRATVDKKYEIPVGKSFNQMKKWNKISSALSGLTRQIPSVTAAYIIYKVAQMSNYVVEKDLGRMSQEAYKRNMVESYSDVIGSIGPAGFGAVVGGLAGTALFPGVGTATLAAVGGTLGAAYGLFSDSFDEGSMWLAAKVFEIFHEDRPVKLKPKEQMNLPTEQDLKKENPPAAPGTSRPPSVYPQPATYQPIDQQALTDATTDKEFMSELNRVSNKFQIKVDDLLAVMAIETAGTFRPDIKNPNSTAVGLLQFTEDTAKRMGTSTSALAMMTRAGQMKYVEKYFEMWNLPKGANAAEIYSTVFLPGRSKDFVLTKQGENFYELNRGLDINKDGQIDKLDLNEWTNRKKAELPRMLGKAGLLEEGAETRIVSAPPDKNQETPVEQTDAVVNAQVNSASALAAVGMVQQQLNVVSSELIKDRRFNQPDDPTVANLNMEQYRKNSIFGRA
jgi:hypothetical protein